MIDPFYMYAYGKPAINYNRDVEAFPLLRRIFQKITGKLVFNSPTEMGLNFVGNAITDQNIVKTAARNEIYRRYLTAKVDEFQGKATEDMVERAKQLCDFVGVSEKDRRVIEKARNKANKTDCVSAAIELDDGRIVCGRAIKDLTCASSVILNALKTMAEIDDKEKLISRSQLEPVVKFKKELLGSVNPRLLLEDCLIAMYATEEQDSRTKRALEMLPRLAGTELHSSAILEERDRVVLKKLRINITADPVYEI